MINRSNGFLPEEQRYDLAYLIQHAKTQALSPFIEDILGILLKEGFSLRQVLESLAQYMEGFPEFEKAANYLDLAAEAVGKIERESNLTEEDNEAI